MEPMPFAKFTFDVVHSSWVFHACTVTQLITSFLEQHRLVRPGGYLWLMGGWSEEQWWHWKGCLYSSWVIRCCGKTKRLMMLRTGGILMGIHFSWNGMRYYNGRLAHTVVKSSASQYERVGMLTSSIGLIVASLHRHPTIELTMDMNGADQYHSLP
jgi:hypothetical protein